MTARTHIFKSGATALGLASMVSDSDSEERKAHKQATLQVLEAWANARGLTDDQAVALAGSGIFSLDRYAARALTVTAASALVAWAAPLFYDFHACYEAFYKGSGRIEDGDFVRLRFLTGAHGLRPIRVRLVSYLVAAPRTVRAVVAEVCGSMLPAMISQVKAEAEVAELAASTALTALEAAAVKAAALQELALVIPRCISFPMMR